MHKSLCKLRVILVRYFIENGIFSIDLWK